MKSLKKVLLAVVMAVGILTGTSYGEDTAVAGYASVDVMSNYVWRGQKLSNSWVVQPSVGITYGGFSTNLWGNYDSDRFEAGSSESGHGEVSEVDFTANYSYAIDKLTLTGGYIYYSFDGANDTQEVYVSAAYDTLLKPALTLFYDYDEGNGAFIVVSVGHSFALPKDMSLNLGALASYNINNKIMGFDKDGNDFSDFYHAELSSSLTIPVTKAVSVTP
ncbi:MAG: hypothetical protein OEW04_10895, partial [Nitrospirota bacterium]|nr:hypothetical protein [Nitrospirota bacterium]